MVDLGLVCGALFYSCCSGLVPLHNACSYGHYEVVELLLMVRGGEGGAKGRGGERRGVNKAPGSVHHYSSGMLISITLSFHLYACDDSSSLPSHPPAPTSSRMVLR